MICATIGDLKKLIAEGKDSDVLMFEVCSENQPEVPKFCSDIADATTLTARYKYARETSDGTRDVIKITLVMDLEACGE